LVGAVVQVRIIFAFCFVTLGLFYDSVHAGGERLYGVHWWEYANGAVGNGAPGGWSVETIVTESAPWWQAPFFAPLYEQVSTTHNAEIITRLDYNWGETVPAPSSSSAESWANKILSEVVNPLGSYARRWIIGNEPNITGEATNWPANRITPAQYASVYHTVRHVIKAARPQDEILFAPVSPGPAFGDVRWKDGNEWLAEAIDATLALPGGAIDGFAIHAYGNPWAGAVQAVAEFHDTFASHLAVIDARSLDDLPVYLTEWNRATWTTGDLAANEQVSADFLRQSLLDVDAWNRTPGNHNIRSLAWFVNQDYGGWEQYSLQWWQRRGNPQGHPGDLWTALMDASQLQAGLAGTRPSADYSGDGEVDLEDFTAWRAAFGRSDWPFADGNRNGQVDAADYTVWRDSYAAAPLAPATIPEPASWLLWVALVIGESIGSGVLGRRGCLRFTGRLF